MLDNDKKTAPESQNSCLLCCYVPFKPAGGFRMFLVTTTSNRRSMVVPGFLFPD